MSIHAFRRDDGEIMVYPPYLADAGGYSIIVWNDMSDEDVRRHERRARQVADAAWKARFGDAVKVETRLDLPETLSNSQHRYLIAVRYGVGVTEAVTT